MHPDQSCLTKRPLMTRLTTANEKKPLRDIIFDCILEFALFRALNR